MTYRIRIEKSAIKEINILPQDVQDRIKKKIKTTLVVNPLPTGNNDIKKISGSKFWRLRIGDYRIFFDVDQDGMIVYVLSIRHRSKAYREL